MSNYYNGEEGMPRSQYHYFIKFWSGHGFYNIERVPEDITIGEYIAQRQREVKGFVLHTISSEWKGLVSAMQIALTGKRRTQEEIDEGGTEHDILTGRHRFA